MFEHILCDFKCKLNSATCNSNKKWNNRTCQCECKYCHNCEKDYSQHNPSTCICENSKYLKNVIDTSVTKYDEIVLVMNNISTKKTNTIATNVTYLLSLIAFRNKF